MSHRLFDLSGRVAVVTGGTTGIGQAIALGLAGAGADVVASSRVVDHASDHDVPQRGVRDAVAAAVESVALLFPGARVDR